MINTGTVSGKVVTKNICQAIIAPDQVTFSSQEAKQLTEKAHQLLLQNKCEASQEIYTLAYDLELSLPARGYLSSRIENARQCQNKNIEFKEVDPSTVEVIREEKGALFAQELAFTSKEIEELAVQGNQALINNQCQQAMERYQAAFEQEEKTNLLAKGFLANQRFYAENCIKSFGKETPKDIPVATHQPSLTPTVVPLPSILPTIIPPIPTSLPQEPIPTPTTAGTTQPTAIPTPTPTPVPQISSANITQNSFTLSWSPISGATKYNVYKNGTELIGNLGVTSTTINSLNANTAYSMQIGAVDQGGEFLRTDILVVKTLANALLSPVIVASLAGNVRDIAINGQYAYLLDDTDDFVIIDLSNPQNPAFIKALPIPLGALGIDIQGNYAYIASNYLKDVQNVNVTNPLVPFIAGSVEIPGTALDVMVQNNYAYYAASAEGLQIVNISNPANPLLVGGANTPGTGLSLAVSGSYAYLADGRDGGLQIINVSDPYSPVIVGSIDTPGEAFKLKVKGNYAYLADGFKGLNIYNISSPTSPSFVGGIETSGDAYDVDIVENIAYIADGLSGLQIVDVSNPSSPTIIDHIDTPGQAHALVINGHYAYIADGNSGLQIIDIAPAS